MVDKEKYSCCKCLKKFTKKEIKQVPSGIYCKVCYADKRKEKRNYLLHDVAGVKRRSELEQEWKRKREIKEDNLRNKIAEPKIRNARVKQKKVSALGQYLTRYEKALLYTKYTSMGMTSDEANKKIKSIVEHISNLVKGLRAQDKSEKEINNKFKEEFAKLCR